MYLNASKYQLFISFSFLSKNHVCSILIYQLQFFSLYSIFFKSIIFVNLPLNSGMKWLEKLQYTNVAPPISASGSCENVLTTINFHLCFASSKFSAHFQRCLQNGNTQPMEVSLFKQEPPTQTFSSRTLRAMFCYQALTFQTFTSLMLMTMARFQS